MKKILWNSKTPFVLNFHITKACNMRCKFCFGGFKETKNRLTKEEWIQLIEKVAEETKHLPNRRINFAGGEPLLIPFLPDLLKKCKEKGIQTSIITNGSLLTKEFIEKNKNNLDMIGISIDSLEEKINKLSGRSVNGKPLSFSEYLSICKNVKEAGLKLKVNTVITN